jgi:hypothetical protein
MWLTRGGFVPVLACSMLAVPLVLGACGSEPTTGSDSAQGPSLPPVPAGETGPEKGFDRGKFSKPTTIDNRWFPLKPGTQFVYEGETIEDDEKIPHRVVMTVTDLTKVVDGVRNVVVWDQDFSAGELEESELAFFAQADDRTLWHFGQYPEAYEEGKLVETPAWIHGVEGAQAGITIKAEPQPGAASYSQGWGPAVAWSDRARVYQTGQKTCVRAGCYTDVLVTDEFSLDEPGAHQLKYYAPGVGNVRVGWAGDDPTRETLELVKVAQLSPAELAEVRAEAMKLEQRAYQNSKEVYGRTTPLQQPS